MIMFVIITVIITISVVGHLVSPSRHQDATPAVHRHVRAGKMHRNVHKMLADQGEKAALGCMGN